MKIGLGFIYRDIDGSRCLAWQKSQLLWSQMAINWHRIDIYDAGTPIFSRSASRNKVVDSNMDCDVVVIADADSIPEEKVLRDAIFGAMVDGMVHFPFDLVCCVDRGDTMRIYQDRTFDDIPISWSYGPSQGGIWVCRPETWWQAGGMDLRLTGWGHEDRIFLICNEVLVGPAVIHPGKLLNLWHPRDDSTVPTERDVAIFNEYNSFVGDPTGLKAYIEQRDLDLDAGVNLFGAY